MFAILGVAAIYGRQPVVMWLVVGVGNTVLFFQILFLIIRAATRRGR